MAVRVQINHVARKRNGLAAPTATAFAYLRDTLITKNVYANPTGGIALAQPVSPDALGNYTQWIETEGEYDIAETIDGVATTYTYDANSSRPPEAWINATMQNSWVNNGGVHPASGYRKDTDEIVYLRGLFNGGTIDAAAFTLPVGYRPPATNVFCVMHNNIFGRIDVTSAGAVIPINHGSSTNAFHSVAGIMFRAA